MVEGRENGDVDLILQKSDTAIKLTFFLGIPFVLYYWMMGGSILSSLYRNIGERVFLAEKLLRIHAVSVVGLSVFQIYSAILQGLQRSKVPVKIMTACMIVKTLLSLLLTPNAGITGTALSAMTGNVLAGVAITVYFINFTGFRKSLIKNVSMITLCGGIMGTIVFLAAKFLSSLWGVLAVGIVSGITYLLSVVVFRVFSREEWKAMPLSSLFEKIDKKINGSLP